MTIQELDIELEKLELLRLATKKKAQELQTARAELLEVEEFDAKLAAMKPAKRQKFLKKLGKTDEEIALIEDKLKNRPVLKVEANSVDLKVHTISNK